METQVAFCAAEGLALSTFTLRRRKLGSSQEVITNNDAAMFVALPDSNIPVSTILWDVELQLGADVVLRLRRNNNKTYLYQGKKEAIQSNRKTDSTTRLRKLSQALRESDHSQ